MKWGIDFVGPIKPMGKLIQSHYILVLINYMARFNGLTLLQLLEKIK
jgi:hypothetical protein